MLRGINNDKWIGNRYVHRCCLVLSVIGVIFLYKSFKRKMDETVRKRFISLEKRIIALENVDCRKN